MLHRLTNSGGALTPRLVRALRERFPAADLYPMYGITEAFRSTYLPPALVDAHPDSMGRAIPFAEVMVVRPDGTRAAPGETGELVHAGPLVSLGYWRDEGRMAERFRPAPAFSKLGGQVLKTVPYNENQASYRAEVNTALAEKPDAVFFVAFPQDGATMTREWISLSVVGPGCFFAPRFIQFATVGRDAQVYPSMYYDFRLDGKPIQTPFRGRLVNARTEFLGPIIGHRAKVAGGLALGPGRMVPNGVTVYPNEATVVNRFPPGLEEGDVIFAGEKGPQKAAMSTSKPSASTTVGATIPSREPST